MHSNEVMFLDLEEGIDRMVKYREGLYEFVLSREGIEMITESGKKLVPIRNIDFFPGQKTKIWLEIRDCTECIEIFMYLRYFYLGGKLPWEQPPENFYQKMQLEVPRERPDPDTLYIPETQKTAEFTQPE